GDVAGFDRVNHAHAARHGGANIGRSAGRVLPIRRVGAIPKRIVSRLLVGGRLVEGIAIGKTGVPAFAGVALTAAVLIELHVARVVGPAWYICDLYTSREGVNVHRTRPELGSI